VISKKLREKLRSGRLASSAWYKRGIYGIDCDEIAQQIDYEIAINRHRAKAARGLFAAAKL
jgi:hypothetical protein